MKTNKELLEEEKQELSVKEAMPAYKTRRYTLDDYYALPEDERYELIDGELFRMDAPDVNHQGALAEIYFQIASYIKRRKGPCKVYFAPCDVQLDCDQFTMVQPDLFILCDQSKNTKKNIYGAPDFILEVLSPSTKSKDMKLKLRKYRQAGVKEYWCIDLEKKHIYVYWFVQSEEAVQKRKKEKELGIVFFQEDEIPVVYDETDDIPVKLYDGDLKIHMKEVFEALKYE